MNEVPSLVAIERAIGLTGSLADFVEMAWHIVEPGAPFYHTWHIDTVCDHLEAVTKGEIRRLVVNVPPGCSKSLIACVFWPTWEWIRDPGGRWLFASFDAKLTERDAKRSLNIIQSPWFQKRWGDIVQVPKDPPVGMIETKAAGFRFATSVRGKATGRHADKHVIDDPTKPSGVSKAELQEASEWRRNTLATRFRDHSKGAQVLIMQRLHEDDLAGECIREGWVHLRLPMEYEAENPCITNWGRDPRTEEGELLCPERFSPADVKTLKKELSAIHSAAQLQQRPVPAGGAIFRVEWFRTWTELPKRFDQMLQSWDCAFKGDSTSDYVVGQVWGRLGPNYYLVDQIRERMGFEATVKAIREMSKKWPKATTKLIEDKANGSAVIEILKKDMPGVVPVNPEGGKEARANAVTGLWEAGNVLIPHSSEWVASFRTELMSFPMGRNDDQVDCMSQCLNYLYRNHSRLKAAMAKVRAGGLF